MRDKIQNHRIQRITDEGTLMEEVKSIEELAGYSFNEEAYIADHVQFAAGSQIHLFLEGPKDKIRIWRTTYDYLKKKYQNSDTKNKDVDTLIESIEAYLVNLGPKVG